MSRFVLSIIGAGNYGTALAYAASWHSKSIVKIIDTSEEKLSQSSMMLEEWFNLEDKWIGPPHEEIYNILERITVSPHLDDIEYSDFVVESITENLPQKNQIIQQIEKIVDPNTVIASTTSHISITKIAQNTQFPHRILGLNYTHFPWMPNVCEIVATIRSSNEAIAMARNYAKRIGLRPSICYDRPGFIANKSIYVMINEAIWMAFQGVAKKEDIDTSLCGTLCMTVGPLEFADLIGLDEILDGLRTLHRETGDDKYKPCPLLINLVNAGMLGAKSGQGFYDYDPNQAINPYWKDCENQKHKEIHKFITLHREIMRKTEPFYEAANLDYLEKFEYEDVRELPIGDLKEDDKNWNTEEFVAEKRKKWTKLFEKIRENKEKPENKQKENEGAKREVEINERNKPRVEKAVKVAENRIEQIKAEIEKLKKDDLFKDLRDPNNPDENLFDWMEKAKEIYGVKDITKKEKNMVQDFIGDYMQKDSTLEPDDFDKKIQDYLKKEEIAAKKKTVEEILPESGEEGEEGEEEEEEDIEDMEEDYESGEDDGKKKRQSRIKRRYSKRLRKIRKQRERAKNEEIKEKQWQELMKQPAIKSETGEKKLKSVLNNPYLNLEAKIKEMNSKNFPSYADLIEQPKKAKNKKNTKTSEDEDEDEDY